MLFEWFKGILFENGRRYAKSHDTERPQREDSKSFPTSCRSTSSEKPSYIHFRCVTGTPGQSMLVKTCAPAMGLLRRGNKIVRQTFQEP